MKKYNAILEIWKIAPFKISALIFLKITQAIMPTVQIYIVGKILDMASFRNLNILPIMFLMLCVSYSWVCDSISKVIWIILKNEIDEYNEMKIIEVVVHVQFHILEDRDIQDKIKRIHEKTVIALSNNFEETMALLSMCLRILGVFSVLLQFSFWGALLIVFTFIPVVIYSIWSGKQNYLIESQNYILERKTKYIEEILSAREFADERYLFSYFEHLIKKWEFLYTTKIKRKIKGICFWFIKSKTASMLSIIAIFVVLGSMLNIVLYNMNEVGLYISAASSLLGLIYVIATDFSNSLDRLADANLFLKERVAVIKMLETYIENDNKNEELEEIEEIEFSNVTFKYPKTNIVVLKNVSFKVKRGECIAFVGENGAGKTTIIRLLLGLYNDYTGDIKINGKSCRHGGVQKYIAMVGQKIVKYPLTVEENIQIGNLSKEFQSDNVDEILKEIGLDKKISKLHKEKKTILSKLYEYGQDLSGGEWQKLAIARAIYADKPIQILDEPTASLDPVTELQVYEQFTKLMKKNKITILISHRLGGIKNADRIFVLQEGTIIEQGSHKELIDLQGSYAKMFKTQSRWYI